MATQVEICNSAIAKVRGKRITSLSDNTTEARLLSDIYEPVCRRLLRSHPWNFAKKRAALAQLSTPPAFEYDYQYQLPSDCLRLLELPEFDVSTPWVLEEEKVILTNETVVNVIYIFRADESKFDANFAEVLAYELAAELAYPLTQGTALSEGLRKRAMEIIRETRSFNGQERGSIRQVSGNEWLNSRV